MKLTPGGNFLQWVYFYLACFSFSRSKTMLSAIYYCQQKTSCSILVTSKTLLLRLLVTTLQFQVHLLFSTLYLIGGVIMTLTTVAERDFAQHTASCFFWLHQMALIVHILQFTVLNNNLCTMDTESLYCQYSAIHETSGTNCPVHSAY